MSALIGSMPTPDPPGPEGRALVLVVEDEESVARGLKHALEAHGYEVDLAGDGALGLQMALTGRHQVVVLDILLPSVNGFKICEQVRKCFPLMPILMLSAKSGEWDQAESLDSGADDYLVKPVSMIVFVAHVRALLRRAEIAASRFLTSGQLKLDLVRHRCTRGDAVVELSGREVEVLACLMTRPGQVISKAELVEAVWGGSFPGDPNIVEVYVNHLRRKLDGSQGSTIIETVRGVGYRLAGE
jgi:two-component system OmpR family response regulator